MSRTTDDYSPRTDVDGDADAGLGRRSYLKFGSTLMVGATLGGLTAGRARADHGILADPAPAELEVGGGESYDNTIDRSDANYVVGTKSDLLAALSEATSGDVVYVEDDAQIDLGKTSGIGVRDGVTLASGRGNGSMGALLHTNYYPDTMFKVYGDNVRFTGLRIRGARWDYFTTGNYDYYASRGIWLLGDDCEVDNCQFYGWTHAAVTVGARKYTNSAHVHHCSIHNNRMEGLGYGVDLLNGHSLVEHNYFDYNRHSIDGFGYATNGYEARYNLVGPNPGSHAFDMHCLSENSVNGGYRAGGTIKIHHNTFQFTEDHHGRAQEAITIRGVPADGAYFEKNWFAHPEKPDGTLVSANGQAYRQENLDSDSWKNIWAAGNVFGDEHEPSSDVGCPRDVTWRSASALAKSDSRYRADVQLDYPNRFDQDVTITAVEIDPRSDAIVRLGDGTYGEGRWQSELHIAADVQDGCTDVGGGQSLPGTITLDGDGHSQSPDTEAVLSAGSTASFALSQFRDGGDDPVDMHREVVHFAVSYRLADGTTGVDEFSTTPVGDIGLKYLDDAKAVSRDGSTPAGVRFGVRNWYDQRLTVTDMRLTPSSNRVAKLADHSYGEGRWASELHVDADVQDGCTDVGGGLDLPGTADFSSDGHSQSPDTEAVLSAGSTASVALWRFDDANGRAVDMTDEPVDVEVSYRLEDGDTATATFTVVPSA